MSERKPAAERTADLLEAAERILERSRRVTVSEIAREAGIASGTFYLYFPSKAHLEAALIERFMQDYTAQAERLVAGDEPLPERLSRTLSGMVEYSLDHAAVLQLQVSHTPTGATRDILSVGIDRIKQVLTDALGAEESGITDPATTAALLYHGVEGVIRNAIAFERDLDADRLVAAIDEQVRSLTAALWSEAA